MSEINAIFISAGISFIVGIALTIITIRITDILSRYPQKLFKTYFDDSHPYHSQEFGKRLILPVGQTCKRFLYVSIKKQCDDIPRIGIRPQENKRWYKRLFQGYNNKTQNIALCERNNSPIRIKAIKDVTPILEEDFSCDGDDGACGRFGYYKPQIETLLQMQPGRQIVYEIEIEALKLWSGFIDFRIDTKDGMRVVHHPCEIR
jgi:hypothetical protein